MSDFLKLTYELIAQIVYFLVEWIVAIVEGFIKLFFTGWPVYVHIFNSYFVHLSLPVKILAIILVVVLVAIPILLFVIIIRKIIYNYRLKKDHADNSVLMKEIGKLNKQVLDLMEEKNKILAMKVNAIGANGTIPYIGGTSLLDGEEMGVGDNSGSTVGEETIVAAATAAAQAQILAEEEKASRSMLSNNRFPKLAIVDEKYQDYVFPEFNNEVTLEEFVEQYRCFAASQLKLYYNHEIIRRFIAGMAASRILILEGISGTGKTSLPYSFSRFLENPCTIVSVQPSFKERTELLGYFNEFSKKFNETEFLRAIYEGGYRQDPSFIVLDEMNLARVEYYFAEMLSILEMPSKDEWKLDLVPTEWEGDPVLLEEGKISIPSTMWYVGTANNDDSTFTITDKVYDRAIPIELNERAAAFECEYTPTCVVTCAHLEEMFKQAREQYPITATTEEKLNKLDKYLQTRFKLAFGNRIIKQMRDFIPVYVACGGTELDGMDYIIARKVLKKFESMNVGFVRDEIKALIVYLEKTFGKNAMQDSKQYLQRIQNLY